MSCIRKAEVGICLVILVQESKNFGLVVGDEAQTGSEECLASLDQEEMSKDQSAKHLQSRNSTSGIPSCVPDSTEPDGETTRCPLLSDFLCPLTILQYMFVHLGVHWHQSPPTSLMQDHTGKVGPEDGGADGGVIAQKSG